MIRREAMKLIAVSTAAATAAPELAAPELAAAPAALPAPLFFTPAELRLVDELTETIIPADEHSPGARGARVAEYLDRRLSEIPESDHAKLWREGLALAGAAASRGEFLTAAARGEAGPKTLEERFFVLLKRETARAYYSSAVGIHKEMDYKGNTAT